MSLQSFTWINKLKLLYQAVFLFKNPILFCQVLKKYDIIIRITVKKVYNIYYFWLIFPNRSLCPLNQLKKCQYYTLKYATQLITRQN